MNKVVLITGFPGAGKTTVVNHLQKIVLNAIVVRYGEVILEVLRRKDKTLTYDKMKKNASGLIDETVVAKADRLVLRRAPKLKQKGSLLMESHAVTKEDFGIKLTPPQNSAFISKINFDAIVFIYCSPKVLLKRIQNNPGQRLTPSLNEIRVGTQLQQGLSLNYSILAKCPLYVVDNSKGEDALQTQLTQIFAKLNLIK